MNKKLFICFEYAILISAFIFLCVFINNYVSYFLSSDDASEMLLSNILAKEGGIFSHNWYYSTEFRVCNLQIVWSSLFHFFNDWHFVRVLGSIFFYCLLLFGVKFYSKESGLNNYFPLLAVWFFLPFSLIYLEFVLRGIFYIPHIVFSLILFGLMFAYEKNYNKINCIFIILATMLSFVASLEGPRFLFLFCIPTFGAVLLYEFFDNKCKDLIKNNYFVYISSVTISSVLACIINMEVLYKIYSFNIYENIKYIPFSIERFMMVINGWFNCLGYRQGGDVFSVDSFYNILAVIVIGLTFYCLCRIIKNRKIYDDKTQIIAYYYLFSIVAFLLLYSFTNMEYFNRYNLPIVVFGFPVVFSCLNEEDEKLKKHFYIMILVVTIFSYFLGLNTFRCLSKKDLNASKKQVVSHLLKQGYYEGYATFWNANILTELSNGKVEVWSWVDIRDDVTDVNDVYHWLQKKSHRYDTPKGKIFILFSNSEKNKFHINKLIGKKYIMLESDDYVLYGFDSYQKMLNVVNQNN